jgi:hypothetical protein
MSDRRPSWWFVILAVGGAAVIWPDVAWQWVQTVGDLFSLGHYMR